MSSPVVRAPICALVLAVGYCPYPSAAQTTDPIPIRAFFGLPNIAAPRISPDGRQIAFLFPFEGRMALGLYDRTTKESRMILRGEDESLFSFFWKGNDRIVFEADYAGNESFFIGSTDLYGRRVLRIAESQRLENNLTGTTAAIVDTLPFDPDHIVVEGFFIENVEQVLFAAAPPTVSRVNVRNKGRSTLLELGEGERLVRLVVDNAGALRIRARLVGHDLVWDHRGTDGGSFHEIARHPFHGYDETWTPVGFAADNRTLWLISREECDRGALYAYDTQTRQRGPALFVPPDGEILEVITSYDRRKLLGVAYETERRHYHWFDPTRAAVQQKLENTFSGADVRVVSSSSDERVMLVWVGHDREPGVYFVLDQSAGTLEEFKRTRDIDPTRLSPRRPISYTARDGLTIHGYLTLPLGATGRRVPLVVHPHGGPFGVRDSWEYDPEAEFLASRGYAVLQPNFRGSGGYGRAFLDKGRRQWGRAMQDDLTDGVKWAISQGIADPARVAIFGASYGGYATLIGLEFTPELYCCGVNYVGAADLELTYKNKGDDAFRGVGDFSYQEEWIGPTSAYRAATSPVNFVDRIRAPSLHAYGAKDPRVKIDHWERLEPLLKKYGKYYEAIEEPRQGHGFRDEKASLDFYRHLEAFLAKYLRGNAPSTQPPGTSVPADARSP